MKEQIRLQQLEANTEGVFALDQYGRLWCMARNEDNGSELYLVQFEDITKYEWPAAE